MCVLLVEDEFFIREIMSECLQDAGYDVIEVENGDTAVELIKHPPCAFTILITDFHMPGDADGSKVAAQVRLINPDIPVVIASGRPEALQPLWQTDLGYKLLRKPYLPSELIKLVESLVGPPSSSPAN
ncbi:MAG: response regulator [Janthinobacterium lividum]